MIEKINLESILFLDIETVPEYKDFSQLTVTKQALYESKTAYQRKDEITPEEFYERAGIWAEFGKIVCISVGYINFKGSERKLRIKSFYGEEKDLLLEFKQLLENHFNTTKHMLCAHNGKEFDFPYLCRRILVHRIKMPDILDLAGKKPWDVKHLDTMQLWKFGDFKSYTSLELLATVFGLETPKDDIDGGDVHSVYYHDKNLERIRAYCEKDVATLANVYLHINGMPHIKNEEVIKV